MIRAPRAGIHETPSQEVGKIQRSRRPIRHICCLSLAVMVCLGSQLGAAEFDVRSETLLRALERDTSKGDDQLILPLYEYLSINYQDLEEGGLSVHLYGWGRKDLTESNLVEDDYIEEDPDGELLYGYLQYAEPYGSFSARLGRQHIFAGITNDTVDGLQLAFDLGSYFTVSAFGGLPAAYNEDNGSGGDQIYGGRLAHHFGRTYQVGVAYQKIVDDGADVTETAGVDLTADLSKHLSINGLSAYNVDTQGWREHRYDADLRMGILVLSPSFHQFDYQDYFGEENLPEAGSLFRFLGETEETLTLYGGVAEVAVGAQAVLGAKATQYTYDVRDEDAVYAAGLLTLGRNSGFEVGVEVGQMQGDSDDNRYRRYRGYGYWQMGLERLPGGFISADAQFVDYEAQIYGERQAQFYALGTGGQIVPDLLTLTVSLIYSQDPYFDEDLSALLSLILDL